MAWATIADVSDITGEVVTTAQLADAEFVITLYAGRTPDMTIGEIDLYWLKHAVARQAKFQKYQPGYGVENSVQEITQDGVKAVFNSESTQTAQQMLAPLAQRALMNLSWKGSRTVSTGRKALASSRPYTDDYEVYSTGWTAY